MSLKNLGNIIQATKQLDIEIGYEKQYGAKINFDAIAKSLNGMGASAVATSAKMAGLNAQQTAYLLKSTKCSASSAAEAMALQGYSRKVIEATLKTAGYTDEKWNLVFASKAFADAEKEGSKEVETFADKISNSFSKTATDIKSVITGIGSFLTTAAGFATIAVGVTALIGAGILYQHKAFDRAVEKAEESKTAYQDLRSEVDSLNSEFETTSNRIKELESLESPSLAEMDELERLKEANDLLQTQIDLKENLARFKREEAAQDAVDVITMERTYVTDEPATVTPDGMIIAQTSTRNILEETKAYYDELDTLVEKREALYKKQSELKPDSFDYKQNEKDLKNLNSQIDTLTSDIDSNLDIIKSSYESMHFENGAIVSGCEKAVESIENFYDAVAEPATESEKALENLKKSFRDNLIKSGIDETIADVLNNEFTTWFDSLSEEDKQLVYEIYCNTDTATWGLTKYQNALNDTKAATIEDTDAMKTALDDAMAATEKHLAGINAATEAVKSQAAGTSLSIDAYNSAELQEYTSALEYNNGVLQLNADKVNELIAAKAEEQISHNEASKALAQTEYLKKAAEIEKLRKKIKEKNFEQGETVESVEAEIATLREENRSLKNQCTQYDLMSASLREATSAYQHWMNAQNASQSGDMFDDAVNAINHINETLNDKTSDLFGRVNRTDYKAAVDFIVPDSIDKTDAKAVQAYLKEFDNYLVPDGSGGFKGLNLAKFCQESVENGLMVFDDASKSYKIAGEKTMEEFAEGLGLSLPVVQAIFGELEEFTSFDWKNDANKTMADLAVEANEAAEALHGINAYDRFNISLDLSQFDTTEDKVEHLDRTMDQMSEIKRLNLNPEDVEYANSILRYCIEQKQALTAPDIMMVDTTMMEGQLGNALLTLQNFVDAKNNLEKTKTLGLDTSVAEQELADATKAVQGLDTSLTGEKALNIDTTDIDSIWDSIEKLNTGDLINIGVNEEAIIGFKNDAETPIDQDVVINVDDKEFVKFKKGLNKKLVATVYVDVQSNDSGKSSSNTGKSGRPNLPITPSYVSDATGTAMAGGNYGTTPGGKTLVGELGEELVVDPRTGRWYTVGTNGAEFVNLPAGSLVFNHLQTESLLKNKFVASRAAAFAKGTAMASGNAMVSGGSISADVIEKYTSPGVGGTSNKHDVKDDLEVFDWIEVAIDRISKAVDKLTSIASSAYKSLKTKLGAAADAITLVNEKIEVQQAAYERYLQEAESVGLSDDLKLKVQTGEIDIAEYDSDTQDLISEYQDLYEKSVEAKDAIADLHEELADLYKERFDNIQEDYNNQLEDLTHLTELYESELEDHKNIDPSEVYDGLRDAQIETIEILTEELEELKQAFADAMSSGLIEEGSDAWYEMRDAIHGVNEELIDAKENLANLAMEEFEGIQDSFDNQTDIIDHAVEQIENEIELLEAKGQSVNEEYYKALQDLEKQRIDMLKQELSDLEKALEEGVASGDIEVGSDAWYEMQSSIADVKSEIQEANVALEEYNQTMCELDWEAFDKQQEALSDTIDANNHQLDLLDHEDHVDDKGNITSAGYNAANLHSSNYDAYMKQANAYAEEIKRIDAELANDPNNEILLERRKELLDLQRDSISAAEDEKQAIKDLKEEAEELRIEAMQEALEEQAETTKEALEEQADAVVEALENQLDSMKELIDSYKDALDNAKDLYDYQRKISEQTDKIGDIEKQLSAYKGDDSEETRAKIQQLKEDLKTAKGDLKEMEYDKYVADQKALLDDIYSQYEQNINERIDEIKNTLEENLDRIDANLESAINSLNAGTDSVIDSILSSTDSLGSTVGGEIQGATGELSGDIQSSIDGSSGDIQSSIDSAAGEVDGQLESTNDTLQDILDTTKDILKEAESAVRDTEVSKDSVDQNMPTNTPSQQQPEPTQPKPSVNTTPTPQPNTQKEITVGGKINAGKAKIYDYAGDTTGENQYFSDDPIYTVLKEQDGYLQVRHHKLTSGATGWFKKSDVKAYKTGGLVDYTGLAQLDGTPSKPELVLNAQDTANFLSLKDMLSKLSQQKLTLQSGAGIYGNVQPVVYTGLLNSTQEIQRMLSQIPVNGAQQTIGDINITIPIEHVQDYDDFKTQLIRDRNFESAIRAMTVDRLVGGSSLAKNKYTR